MNHILGGVTSVGDYYRQTLINHASPINEPIVDIVINGNWYIYHRP